jgi:hypothetical protein
VSRTAFPTVTGLTTDEALAYWREHFSSDEGRARFDEADLREIIERVLIAVWYGREPLLGPTGNTRTH